MLSRTLSYRYLLLHPNYFCSNSPIRPANDRLSVFPTKKLSLVRRMSTSSMSVTSSFLTIHCS